jgi:cyclophilin family peptidyl-prolyl cis-trans isomerase
MKTHSLAVNSKRAFNVDALNRQCSNIQQRALITLITVLLIFFSNTALYADETRARVAMADPENPLVAVFTSKGAFYIELYARQAPRNVARFISLVSGEYDFSGTELKSRYYDQSSFHTVVPGGTLLVGNPAFNRLGLQPVPINAEIDGVALGLDTRPLFSSGGEIDTNLAIANREKFEREILTPLYSAEGINTAQALRSSSEQMMQRLQQMSVLDVLENLGYRYAATLDTQPITQGTVALMTTTPGETGVELVVSLRPSPWLDGRVTPIGKVVEGLSVIGGIGSIEVSPRHNAELATTIYSMRIL